MLSVNFTPCFVVFPPTRFASIARCTPLNKADTTQLILKSASFKSNSSIGQEGLPDASHLRSRTPITLPDLDGPLAAHAIRLAIAPPPNLIAVDCRIGSVLTRVEQPVPIVAQIARRAEAEARGPHAGWGAAVGHREAYGLRLVGDDVHFLEAGGRGVDREEGQAVAGAVDAGALDDERFGVLLVFDLADVGGAVGVEEAVAL